eukprot:6484770-Amphidinium_carterae.1
MNEKSLEIHKMIKIRTNAWESMNHYEQKVQQLREQVMCKNCNLEQPINHTPPTVPPKMVAYVNI